MKQHIEKLTGDKHHVIRKINELVEAWNSQDTPTEDCRAIGEEDGGWSPEGWQEHLKRIGKLTSQEPPKVSECECKHPYCPLRHEKCSHQKWFYKKFGRYMEKECQVCEEESKPELNVEERDFWYIDLNGRIQHKSHMPVPLDEGGEWFGNKFYSCNEAIIARDKIRVLLTQSKGNYEQTIWKTEQVKQSKSQ